MFRSVLFFAALVPGFASAADFSSGISVEESRHRVCPRMQDGTQYCVEDPVERRIADCNFGVACYHMQNGQHYTTQRPLVRE